MAKGKKSPALREAAIYTHPTADMPLRPEIGTQPQFKKTKPAQKYRYDSSLAPALEWDGQNSKREQGEALIDEIMAHAAAVERGPLTHPPGTLSPSGGEGRGEGAAAKSAAAILEAAQKLKALSRPFLNWSGKAERLSFDVPTLPLFVHERLSTQAIIETLTGHKKDKQTTMFDLFGDPQHSVADQVLKAYEHRDQWVNRMILGDGLVVMNSLLHYENMGGQVQMIYIDPPYGVKFGSNFQPFVRKRDVSHGDDEDMTREPEMVQAYRDTWELGLHSYLTYLRDRLLLARDLLTPSGSVFVQISDENLHHVRELMDEVFGAENFCSIIIVKKTTGLTSDIVASVCDYLLWYAKDHDRVKNRSIFKEESLSEAIAGEFRFLNLGEGKHRLLTPEELANPNLVDKAKLFRTNTAISPGIRANTTGKFTFNGMTFDSGPTRNWKTSMDGMVRLAELGRLTFGSDPTRMYKQFWNDFPFTRLTNIWDDLRSEQNRLYVVQTTAKVIQRCMLMTTDPGDLVLDPTCGSGTTAYVAENWGRRWITCDVSRVPLALARQRLLTATFSWFKLKDDARGPAGGFVYERRQNNKGEEVGGIVPHVTLKSIANNEKADEEVLVDRPEELKSVTRVTGPFVFEASIPTTMEWEERGVHAASPSASPEASQSGDASADVTLKRTEVRAPEPHGSFSARLLEILRKSPVLRLDGNRTVTLKNIRPPAKSLTLSAEALVDTRSVLDCGSPLPLAHAAPVPSESARGLAQSKSSRSDDTSLNAQPVAFVFGPENGAVSEKLVYEAAFEAKAKSYTHLYVVGFAIQPTARELVEKCADVMGIAATYVQATPDLLMGDLLKNMRSSQIFSVCGLPEVKASKVQSPKSKADEGKYQVELIGLDVFDPITMEVDHRHGNDVPAWLLDTDYNGLCFHVSQAFFPRTSAWDNLKKCLKGEYDEAVWDHLAGNISAPFPAGEHKQIAVKVIDDRGNELLVVKKLEGGK